MKNKWLLLPLAMLLLIMSCTKRNNESVEPVNNPTNESTINENEFATTEFAKVLAKALTTKEVREIIKQEALKRFDKDYDILYQFSKDVSFNGSKSLQQILAGYAKDSVAFINLTEQLPLITIFVPHIHNFNPEDWNTDQQIPIVAVRKTSSIKKEEVLNAYNSREEEIILNYRKSPEQPVIVVKENERVTYVDNNNNERKVESKTSFLRTARGIFSFTDECYDGLNTKSATTTGSRMIIPIDPLGIYARNQQIEPVRDYIYYGIDPSTGVGSGPLKNNYAEFLMGMKPISADSKSFFVDWTDGMLEFRLTTFFIPREGAISSITKHFPCDPDKLFGPNGSIGELDLTANPIELANWDMEKYGDAWKLVLIEFDPGSETTYTTSFSSTFGWNFGLDVGLGTLVKIGLKFGISQTKTRSESVSVKITDTSDNLGETILDYSTPLQVINPYAPPRPGQGPQYLPYSINTGIMQMYITTKKRF
jgi:hypothetical protein